MLVVVYSTFTQDDPKPANVWDDENGKLSGRLGTYVKLTLIQQKAVLRILEVNSNYIPDSFRPNTTPLEAKFKTSVILPFGPLSFEALGKLNIDTGCMICGGKMAKKCAQCHSVGIAAPVNFPPSLLLMTHLSHSVNYYFVYQNARSWTGRTINRHVSPLRAQRGELSVSQTLCLEPTR